MLDTIRAYAAEKLAAAGEAAAVRHRFRDHTLGVAERNFAVGMALVPAPWRDRVDVFRRYDVDAGNVWLVLGQCLAEGEVSTGLRICTAVRPCMLVRGEFALGCEWIDAFLSRPEAADVEPRIRGQALIGRAQLSLPVDPAAAEPVARAGLGLCRAAGDQFWTAAGLNLLSEIAVHTGRPDEAEALGQEAMAIAEAAGDGWNKGWALGIRAAVAGVRGDIRAGGGPGPRLGRRHALDRPPVGCRPGPARPRRSRPAPRRPAGGPAHVRRRARLPAGDRRQAGDRPLPVRPRPGRARTRQPRVGQGAPGGKPAGLPWTSAPGSGWPAASRRSPRSPTARATRSVPCCSRAASGALRATSGLPPAAGRPRGRLRRRGRQARRGQGRPAVGARPCAIPRGRHRPGHRAARPGTAAAGRGR